MPINPANEIDVGKIKLVWRGTYSGSTAYEVDDLVQYDDGYSDSAYICVANTTGNVPSTSGTVNTTYWNLAAKGASSVSFGDINGVIQYKSSSGFGATSDFIWNDGNNRLGIGSTQPTSTLNVQGTTSLSNLIVSGISTLGVTTFTSTLVNTYFEDKCQIVSGTANGTSNIDIKISDFYLFTSNSTASWTHNIRGDASTTLNSILSVGQSLVVTIVSKQNNSSYYTTSLNIDGVSQTVNWSNAITPSSGKSSGYDLYIFVIIKTGNSAYIVLGSQNN